MHGLAWPGLALPGLALPGQAWPSVAATGRERQPGDKPLTTPPGMPHCLVAPLLSNRLDNALKWSAIKLATVGTAGRDVWFGIRWRRKTAKGQQSLESGATLTLGSMFLARFSKKLQPTMNLTNAFESYFRDDSFEQCSKIAGFLRKHAWG